MSSPTPPSEPRPAPAKIGQMVKGFVALAVLITAGVFIWRELHPKPFYQFSPKTMAFVEHAQSNTPLEGCDVEALRFVGIDGEGVDLKQFLDQKNVVLVVTRGNTARTGNTAYDGNICLYCATQTARLIANYPAFQDHQAEVVVVFPIRKPAESGSLDTFRESLSRVGAERQPPFPLVLDVELRAVDQLGIRADLSKPATYIVDKKGQVRFAYVGASVADRPSVQSLLEQLDAINADAN
jgi:peroxiredoxin